MLIVLDTNALVRYFTNDIPKKAEQVEKLLKQEKCVCIPDVVFPEIEYILLREYNVSREKVLESYKFLLAQKNIDISAAVKNAIALYEVSSLDMADTIIASYSLKGKLASFDKMLLQNPGVHPFWE